MKRLLFFLILFAPVLQAQDKDYFISPLDVPLYLAGNFGELRSNHFHTGIDIKTQGVEGLKVYAAASGFVSRISVSPWGYGKALYIDHPNGTTTVYAHLQKFSEEIEEYVRNAQYQLENFQVELYPDADALVVEQGDWVAYSGNSGSSGGPHVHFEIRDTKTEKPINPLIYNFDIKDNIAPYVKGVRFYPMDEGSLLEGENVEKSYVVTGGNGKYRLKYEKHIPLVGKFGVAIHTLDKFDGVSNIFGVYEIKLRHNDRLIFHQRMDTLDFSTSRYINCHKDFHLFHKNRWHYHKSFLLPNNKLEIYKAVENQGIIEVEEGSRDTLYYEVSDFDGNIATLAIPLRGDEKKLDHPDLSEHTEPVLFSHNTENLFTTDEVVISMPPKSLYDDLAFVYLEKDGLKDGIGKVHGIHDHFIPVHKKYRVRLNNSEVPEEYRNKALVVNVTNGRRKAYGGKMKGRWLTAKVKEFGDYTIMLDTIPPNIKPINFFNGKNITRQSTLVVRVSDNLSGIAEYNAYMNDQWVLMEYDGKAGTLTCDLTDKRIPEGIMKFRLIVSDERRNVETYECILTR